MAAVTRVLEEVGATTVDRIDVYNKCDLLTPDERRRLAESDPSALLISATTGEGCGALLDTVAARLALDQQRVSLEFDLSPDADRDRLAWLYRHARVHSQVMHGDRATIEADVPASPARPRAPAPARRKAAARGETGVSRCATCSWRVDARIALGRSLLRFARQRALRPARRGCASRAPVMPPAPATLRHPEFRYPTVPPAADAEQATRIERGWRYLQSDNLRGAEREFESALKLQPSFHPAQTGLGYIGLARKDADDAVVRFERALEREAAYVPALVGRGQALLELKRDGEALSSFEAALKADASLDRSARAASRCCASAPCRTTWRGPRPPATAGAGPRPVPPTTRRSWPRPIRRSSIAISRSSSARPASRRRRSSTFGRPFRSIASDARSQAQIGEILEEQGDAEGALEAYLEGARARSGGGRRRRASTRLKEALALTPDCPPSIARSRRRLPRPGRTSRRSSASAWSRSARPDAAAPGGRDRPARPLGGAVDPRRGSRRRDGHAAELHVPTRRARPPRRSRADRVARARADRARASRTRRKRGWRRAPRWPMWRRRT